MEGNRLRRAARTDSNHREIIDGLRKEGFTVLDLSRVGQGCPDILVGYAGHNWLMEIKDGGKPPSARRLPGPEQAFYDLWKGNVNVVCDLDQAVEIIKERHE